MSGFESAGAVGLLEEEEGGEEAAAAARMAERLRMQMEVCSVMDVEGGAISPVGEPGTWPEMKRRRVDAGMRMAWDCFSG